MTLRETERTCPTCRAKVRPIAENDAFPFCSRRCQLADLGSWLDEGYRIPTDDELQDDPDRRDR